MGERVGGAEVFLKGDAAHGRRDLHETAGLEIASLVHRTRKGSGDQVNALERDAIAQRMKHGRGKRLDAVREGIGTGGGGELCRQSAGKFRVEDDEGGEKGRVKEDALAT